MEFNIKTINITNKKAQIGVLSFFFLITIFIFFYSIETPNTFNTQPSKIYIIDSIENQFCNHVKATSNGTILNSSLELFDIKMIEYCDIMRIDCEFDSYVFNPPPGDNLSLLMFNDTQLNYTISDNFFEVSSTVRCS